MRSKKSDAKISDILGYTYPRLHEGKKWYIDFLAIDPETRQLKRKKYYIPAQKNKKEMRANASVLIEKLTIRLRQGWSPWASTKSLGHTKLLDEILDSYLISLQLNSRKATIHSYTSRVNVLRQYISTLQSPPMYALHFDRLFITGFLDWIIEHRHANARTRNNYRQWCGTLADYMIERGMLTENPVGSIRKIKESERIRQPLDSFMLSTLWAHLDKTGDRHFLLACMMEYYTFIRPNELRHIRICDISVRQQTVFIQATVSKNRRDGKVSLNEEIIRLMLDLGIFSSPSDWYIFGKNFKPAPEMADSDIFNKKWALVRKAVGLPYECKFYSLKDAGIRDLSNAAGVVTARDQARHQDISTTNRYLQGRDLQAPEAAKHFTGALTAPGKTPPS